MSANITDYDKIVKDHLRMRLMETGWTDQLGCLIKDAITKRVEAGQTTKSIKFEQLYSDVIEGARDAVSNEIEDEFHQKIGEYLSLNLDGIQSSSASSKVPADIPAKDPSPIQTRRSSRVSSTIVSNNG